MKDSNPDLLKKQRRSRYDGKKWQPSGISGIRFKYHETRKVKTMPDKYWAIYYYHKGKTHEESVGWTSKGFTKQYVIECLQELKRNHLTGRGPQTLKEMRALEDASRQAEQAEQEQEERDNITFENFFNEVFLPLQKINTKKESWRKAQSHAKIWINPELGHLPIRSLSSKDLEKIKKKMLRKNKSPRTIQYVFVTIGSVWRLAQKNGLVDGRSPLGYVKLPKFDNKVLRFFTRKEADSLLAELEKRSKKWHAICLISLHTGMRVGEVYSLTWGDVNLQTKTGTARDTKSVARTRYIYFTQEVTDILDKLYDKQPSRELVFKNKFGEKISSVSSTVYRTIEDLGLNHGVADKRHRASCHTFRHTYASWLIQSGKVTLYELKELLGHGTIQQTERYSKLLPSGIKKAASVFEDILS